MLGLVGSLFAVTLARDEGGAQRNGETVFDVELVLGEKNGRQQYIFLKEAGGTRRWYYSTGACDAQAVRWLLKPGDWGRPPAANVAINAIRASGGEVRAVAIHDVANGIIFANVQIAQNGRLLLIDSRPSDAIAFAIAAGAPILVSEKLLLPPIVAGETIHDN